MPGARERAVERLGSFLDGLSTYAANVGNSDLGAVHLDAVLCGEASIGGRKLADAVLRTLGLVAADPSLLTTRDEQKASEDEVTTLRHDARYLRGLAASGREGQMVLAWGPSDEATCKRIAAKLDAVAELVEQAGQLRPGAHEVDALVETLKRAFLVAMRPGHTDGFFDAADEHRKALSRLAELAGGRPR